MMTFTGIVLDKENDEEEEIRKSLEQCQHLSFDWENIIRIGVPPLSSKEILEINKLLPCENAKQQLIDKFPFIFKEQDSDSIESYISFYKYYPNYHHVSF